MSVMARSGDVVDTGGIASALRTMTAEVDGLRALADGLQGELGAAFTRALDLISGVRGRVIVTGVGKSGHVGVKMAATLASTGTPAFFVHAAEASHGDLGMIGRDDVVLALSWSGESAELKTIVSYSRRFSIPLIAFTSRIDSALGKEADIVLQLPRVTEACPHGLAPTTSTTMQLALGDALAVALLERRGFTPSDFRVYHPGGQLGANLKHVSDIMLTGDAIPLAESGTPMSEAIITMSQKGVGCVGVVKDGILVGIITDGDLRRHIADDLLGRTVDEVMTRNPKTIEPDMLAARALDYINGAGGAFKRITALMVTREGRPVGFLHIQDLVRAGVA